MILVADLSNVGSALLKSLFIDDNDLSGTDLFGTVSARFICFS